MQKLILIVMFLFLSSWSRSADAAGPFSCSSPCVNGDSGVGNGYVPTDSLTISNAVAGHPILVFNRGGVHSSTVTMINDSGPATLNWILLASLSPALASDWVYSVHCAMVPTNGTYLFRATNNTNNGPPSGRIWAMQLDQGTCAGAIFSIKTQFSGTPTSNSITLPTGTYVVVTGAASDGDIDTAQANHLRSISNGIIVNANCNTTGVAAPEPDQKGCIGVIGLKTEGSYSANWSTGTDIWTVVIVALPTKKSVDVTRPSAPKNLKIL